MATAFFDRFLLAALACIGALAAWFSWPSLLFYFLFSPLGANPQGFCECRHRQTGIVFVSLPGGKLRGSQKPLALPSAPRCWCGWAR